MDFLPNQKTSKTDIAVANARATVGQFLTYLRDNPLGREIRSSEQLPLGKGPLIDAFRLLIAHELRAEQSGQLQKVGLYLAQFRQREDGSSKEDTVLRSGEFAASEEWEQIFAEQEKLQKLFRLSARYSRRDVTIRSVRGQTGFGNANRLDG